MNIRILLLAFIILLPIAPSALGANGSIGTATPLAFGTPVVDSVEGYTSGDYFTVTTSADGKVTVQLQHDYVNSGSTLWSLQIMDATGTTRFVDASIPGNRTVSVYDVGLPAGTYVVRITYNDFSTAPYTLTAQFAPGAGFEKESNDTEATATSAIFGTEYSGALQERYSAPDKDWYRLVLPADGEITVSVGHDDAQDSTAFWQLVLKNEAGDREYLNVPIARSGTGDLYQVGLPAGVYLIRIVKVYTYDLSSFITAPYTLTIGFSAGPSHERELNDTLATATPLAVGATATGSLQERTITDVDWYSFTLPAAGKATVSLTAAEPGSSWQMRVLDATGAIEYLGVSTTGGVSDSAFPIGLPAGTYSVRIDGASPTPYTLGVTFTPGTFFEREVNDTTAAATPVNLNERWYGFLQPKSGDDLDFYRFTVPAAGTLPVNVTVPAASYVWLEIFNGEGNSVYGASVSTPTTLEVPFIAGSYTLGMRTGYSAYDFRIGYPDSTPPAVRKISPSLGAEEVGLTAQVVVEYSEEIDPTSVTAETVSFGNGVVGSAGVNRNILTFTPSTKLSHSTTYEITVSGSVRDLAGNPVGTDTRWTFSTLSAAGLIHLPKTGQASCNDSAGGAVSCAGTGQDGDVKAGVSWPDSRFADNGNGTIRDRLTGLVWAKNANLMSSRNPSFDNIGVAGDGIVTWSHALGYIKKLNAESYLGFNDWRLPNLFEMESLLNLSQADSRSWLSTSGFQNVGDIYLTSSPHFNYHAGVWGVSMAEGRRIGSISTEKTPQKMWPVRGGSGGAIRLPATGITTCTDEQNYQIACGGTGEDGEGLKGVPVPAERFRYESGVTLDTFTGLIWAGSAGTFTWQGALDHVKNLNSGKYLGYSDWRVPNRMEMTTLHDFSTYDITDYYNEHWTSTNFGDKADVVDMWNGKVFREPKTSSYKLRPVRGGANGAVAGIPASHDFGVVEVGTTSPVQVVDVSNNTPDILVLAPAIGGTHSAMFTVAPGGRNPCDLPATRLNPGESCTLEVAFAPTSAGAKSAALSLTTGATPVLSVPLTGSGSKTTGILSVAVTGSGGGSINSTPAGIACTSGTCSAAFPLGTSVTLFPSPDSNSIFSSWTGSCSGSGNCNLSMSDDRAAAGTFTFVQPVRIPGTVVHYFPAIQLAYASIPAGGSATINTRSITFDENLVFDNNVGVVLAGGFDSSYSVNAGRTVVKGKLSIRRGSIRPAKLAVR